MKRQFVMPLLCSLGLLFAVTGLTSPAQTQPPSGLVVTGVPPIPDAIMQATAPYWKVKEDYFMDWDPKTGAMLINTQGKETRQLHLLMAPEGEVKLTTLFADAISGASFMPPGGSPIVFEADHDGNEFYQLYSLDPATGKTQLLTDGDSRNDSVIYDHTGKQIAFLSTMSGGRYEVIYVMDPRNPDSRRIIMTPDSDGWLMCDWAHDGGHIVVSHLTGWGGYLWSINTSTGETKMLTTTPETQRYYLKAQYTPQDNGLFVVVLGTHAKLTIDYLPLTNDGPVRKVPKDVEDVLDMELSPDANWIAYVRGEKDSQTLHIFNTITGEEVPKIPLAPALFARIRWTEDSTQIGFNYGSATLPFQAYAYNVPNHQLTQWTRINVSDLPDIPVKPELVKINSFDELEISGYLYRPDPRKFPGKRPVVVAIHGGPASEYIPEYLGAYNYYLDGLGVALFYPNVRGSTGFGTRFMDLDNEYKREDSVKDIGAVLDWIETDPRLDSSRIGVQGGSYGGYMVLASLYHYGNRLRCGSDEMGITDFVTLLRHTKKWWQPSARREFGDERYPEMNKFLEGISPLNHAAEIHDPLMIAAGKSDPRVPESESDQMVKAMNAQNGMVWYLLGENEGHGFRRASDEQYRFAAEAYFFQTYLLPEKRLTPLGPPPAEIKPSDPSMTAKPD